MKPENTLGKLGLGMAIGGAVLGLFVVFASGMSNARQQAKWEVLVALPVPSIGFLLSVASIIVARRQRNWKAFAPVAIFGLAISIAVIVLTLTAWNSYK